MTFTPTPTTALFDVVGHGVPVPTVLGGTVPYLNLDVAASAPALVDVAAAVQELLPWYSSVHRGTGYLSGVCTELLESARAAVGAFVGAPADAIVLFTRNTTDAVNLLARALPLGTSVVTFASEHHANLLPWLGADAVVLPVPASPEEAIERAATALRRAHGPALLAVTGASNVTGELWPIRELAATAHAAGARIFVDAAQLAPHRRVDLTALDVDYLALSGHKLYAPFGAGALVGRADWLDAADPYLPGGGASRSVTADDVVWHTGPDRHEGGTPNLVGSVALGVAARSLGRVGMDVVEAHEAGLVDHLSQGLDHLGGVERYAIWPERSDRVGVVSFNVDGFSAGHLASVLSAEHGIGVRAGAFCAHRLTAHLTPTRAENTAVRVSLGSFHASEDVDRFLAALDEVIGYGPAWQYAGVEGGFAPEPDPRPGPAFTYLA